MTRNAAALNRTGLPRMVESMTITEDAALRFVHQHGGSLSDREAVYHNLRGDLVELARRGYIDVTGAGDYRLTERGRNNVLGIGAQVATTTGIEPGASIIMAVTYADATPTLDRGAVGTIERDADITGLYYVRFEGRAELVLVGEGDFSVYEAPVNDPALYERALFSDDDLLLATVNIGAWVKDESLCRYGFVVEYGALKLGRKWAVGFRVDVGDGKLEFWFAQYTKVLAQGHWYVRKDDDDTAQDQPESAGGLLAVGGDVSPEPGPTVVERGAAGTGGAATEPAAPTGSGPSRLDQGPEAQAGLAALFHANGQVRPAEALSDFERVQLILYLNALTEERAA